jgi:hypothetical protein
MLAATSVSTFLTEDVELIASTHVTRTGAVRAWVHIGGYESSLWGSPPAMRRFAAAVVKAADSAERQGGEQRAPASREVA